MTRSVSLTRRGAEALGIDGVSRKVGVEIARERQTLAAEVTVRAGAEARGIPRSVQ